MTENSNIITEVNYNNAVFLSLCVKSAEEESCGNKFSDALHF